MQALFSQKDTRQWVKFFVIAQVLAHVLLIGVMVAEGYSTRPLSWLAPWLNAWLIIYSPLNIILSLIQGPSYFSPLAFFPWLGPIVLIYPYSLILGGAAAYLQKSIKRPK